ncbi:MAG: hypothetical protein Q8K63_04855 [Acidimicrobiales bacterium]|nr:hypothetical protein [Acidimicrobiales bacterium]
MVAPSLQVLTTGAVVVDVVVGGGVVVVVVVGAGAVVVVVVGAVVVVVVVGATVVEVVVVVGHGLRQRAAADAGVASLTAAKTAKVRKPATRARCIRSRFTDWSFRFGRLPGTHPIGRSWAEVERPLGKYAVQRPSSG